MYIVSALKEKKILNHVSILMIIENTIEKFIILSMEYKKMFRLCFKEDESQRLSDVATL